MTAIHYKNYRRAIADNAMDNKKQAEDEITNYAITYPYPEGIVHHISRPNENEMEIF